MKAHVGIVGGGVIGLTSALLLVKEGHQVTVVAKNLPGDLSDEWASPWAGALLAPHPDADFVRIQEKSLEGWHALLEKSPECGLREVDIEEYYDDRADDSSIWYRKLYPEMKSIPKPDLPPGSTLGFQYRGLVGDPNVFLPWIFTTLQHMGVKFLRRSISTLQELEEATGAEILINASGLGARELASDSKVYPVRGQTMFVVCPDEDSVHYKQTVLLQGSQYTYAIPRKHSGGIILGGVSEPHDTSSAVSESTRVDILARVNKMTGGKFKWVDLDRHVRRDIVGFRPSREGGLRVERDRHVVHAYGAGGLGYLYAFGVAKEVRQLVSQAQRHSFAKL